MSHLRAVGPDESVPAAKDLVEAVDRSRRELLATARLMIARTLEAGVPAHAMGRLVTDLERLDGEIRRIDAADEQEAQRREGGERRSFNQAAI